MLDASAKARRVLEVGALGAGRTLGRLGVTPNAVTATGVLLTLVAGWLVVRESLVAAGLVLVAGGILDFFDGGVARATGKATALGAFLDSMADRISDTVILSTVAWILIRDDRGLVAVAALTALGASLLTSYVRAKAESLGYTCKIGLVERAERVVILIAGLVFGLLEAAVVVLAAGSIVTVVQRLIHVGRQANARS